MQSMSYDLDAYSSIIFTGINYSIPDNVKEIIQTLISELGVTTTIDTTNQIEREPNNKRPTLHNLSRKPIKSNGNKKNTQDDDSWEKVKRFQSTKIEKKEGFDKIVNDICVCVNKISNKNYDVQRDAIFHLIHQNIINNDQEGTIGASPSISVGERPTSSADVPDVDEETMQDNLKKISNTIFNIASTNKFYSEIYASLYKELIVEFPVFNDVVDGFIQQYIDSVNMITFVDQNIDYDKFCDNNKLNDKRKAMAAFIVNLMIRNVIDETKVSEIMIQIENMILSYVNEPNRTYEVDEITENLFIFITMSINHLKHIANWNIIVENIKTCSQYKAKDFTSLSSRAIFKYMDLCDFIKKNNN
jgi:hypothetical protein